jgi:hypothetical protein
MTWRAILGDKAQNKGKGKIPKASKHGLRPHEQREQDAVKSPASLGRPVADRRIPKM